MKMERERERRVGWEEEGEPMGRLEGWMERMLMRAEESMRETERER